MPVIKTIGTGGDYPTVQAWADAIPTVLADRYIGRVLNEELVVADNDLVTFGAHDTTPDFDIILEGIPGGTFQDNPHPVGRYNPAFGAALRVTGEAKVIRIDGLVDYITIRNLQMKAEGSGDYDSPIYSAIRGLNHQYLDLIAEGFLSNSVFAIAYVGQATFRNCLFISRGSGGNGIKNVDNAPCTIDHCTIARPSNLTPAQIGIYAHFYGDNVKNCAVFGFEVDYDPRQYGNSDVDYNATPFALEASGFPTPAPNHNVYAVPFDATTFVQSSDVDGLHDFRLVAGCGLENVGVQDASTPNDILDNLREDPPEIGAFEIIAEPPPTPDPPAPTIPTRRPPSVLMDSSDGAFIIKPGFGRG